MITPSVSNTTARHAHSLAGPVRTGCPFAGGPRVAWPPPFSMGTRTGPAGKPPAGRPSAEAEPPPGDADRVDPQPEVPVAAGPGLVRLLREAPEGLGFVDEVGRAGDLHAPPDGERLVELVHLEGDLLAVTV